MGDPVFDSEVFGQWLRQKSAEIVAKVPNEKFTNEDMLILSFQHMDNEFRHEFKNIDKRFEQVDKRFEQMRATMTWGFGLIITLISGIYIKLIF